MSSSNLSSAQRTVQTKLGDYLGGQLGTRPQEYNGQLTAGLLPGLQQLGGMLGGYDPSMYNQMSNQGLQSALGSLYGQAPQQLGAEPSVETIGVDPVTEYWKQSTLNPMMRQFHNVIKPQIKASYAGQSGFSSRQGNQIAGAQNQMLIGAQDQLGQMQNQVLTQNAQMEQNQIGRQNSRDQTNAGLAMDQYGQQINGLGQIGNAAFSNAMAPIQQGSAMAQALQPLQSNANLGAQNQYQDWIRTQRENSPWIQLAMQFMGQRTNTPTQPQNPWATVAGAALPIVANAYAASQTKPAGQQGQTNGYDNGSYRSY